jgi:glycosyltransferase involved in cell wall biosynthesis
MRILHVNTNDKDGGAARAAFRIHNGLLTRLVKSTFFVKEKTINSEHIITPLGKLNRLKIFINDRVDPLIKKICKISPHTPWDTDEAIFDIVNPTIMNKYDIVNLHWINGGFLPIRKITKIKQPIVWTLHDSWAFTGGCNIPYDCKKYMIRCEKCEQLGGLSRVDLCEYVFKSKLQAYQRNMVIVCPSRWLAECAKQSVLFKKMDIRVIPNGIDTIKYKPCNKIFARKVLGLNLDCKIILFGAMNAVSDENKGYKYLYQAICKLYVEQQSNEHIELVIFGCDYDKNVADFGFKTWFMGRLYDDVSLALLYSAADIMVVPSKSENLPNTILESMACGTPVVAFSVGGIPDIIEHKINGYLVKPYDIELLTDGIKYILEDDIRWEILSKNARQKIVNNFDTSIITDKYIDLYSQILKNRS